MTLVVEEQVGLQRPQISVIIPARNEAQNLAHVLPYIPSIVSKVTLVNGHSTDDTIAVAQQLLPSIRIVEQVGQGKGDALEKRAFLRVKCYFYLALKDELYFLSNSIYSRSFLKRHSSPPKYAPREMTHGSPTLEELLF